MKAVNHTGFCSGHRGFKRKGSAVDDRDLTPGRRRKGSQTSRARASSGSLPLRMEGAGLRALGAMSGTLLL
jgi:hypothetical protein